MLERRFGRLARDIPAPHIDQHDVRIGAVGNDPEAPIHQAGRQSLGIGHDLCRIDPELRQLRFTERNRLGCNDVLERTTLRPREHRPIDGAAQIGLCQDQSAPRSAQRLVRRRGNHLRMRHRRRIDPAGHQPGKVRHVDQQPGTDLVGDGPKSGKIDDPRIGAAAADNQLGLLPQRDGPHFVEFDQTGVRIDPVVHRAPDGPAVIDIVPVRKMPTMRQRHAEQSFAGRNQRHKGREIRLRTRMWLDVGVLGAEQRLGSIDGQLLDFVDDLIATVIALARIPFGIFVGQRGAHRIDHRPRREVLARNQFEPVPLPGELPIDHRRHHRIGNA